ncbi:MAG: hypothetical protein ABEN55_20380 [Bradymonadaceae bacterium]
MEVEEIGVIIAVIAILGFTVYQALQPAPVVKATGVDPEGCGTFSETDVYGVHTPSGCYDVEASAARHVEPGECYRLIRDDEEYEDARPADCSERNQGDADG